MLNLFLTSYLDFCHKLIIFHLNKGYVKKPRNYIYSHNTLQFIKGASRYNNIGRLKSFIAFCAKFIPHIVLGFLS